MNYTSHAIANIWIYVATYSPSREMAHKINVPCVLASPRTIHRKWYWGQASIHAGHEFNKHDLRSRKKSKQPEDNAKIRLHIEQGNGMKLYRRSCEIHPFLHSKSISIFNRLNEHCIFTFPFSSKFVNMTIIEQLHSITIRQNSSVWSSIGPCAAM